VNCRAARPAGSDERLRAPPAWRAGRGRVAGRDESRSVPLEQIGQSAVNRLWRQKSEFKTEANQSIRTRLAKISP
jgi:hypothetical protein